MDGRSDVGAKDLQIPLDQDSVDDEEECSDNRGDKEKKACRIGMDKTPPHVIRCLLMFAD